MKKILVVLAILTSSSVYCQHQLGAKVAYASEIESFGAGLRGVLNINENFSFSPEISVFLPSNRNIFLEEFQASPEIETRLVLFNADFHYRLDLYIPKAQLYLIAGANYTDVDKRLDDQSISSSDYSELRDSGVGANVGVGADYILKDNLRAFVEAKYIINTYDQAVISIGLLADL
ncbi:MAG: outer membrane beta-barrel protein [Bacteroidota bacterium]